MFTSININSNIYIKIKAAIFETAQIVQDFRSQVLGGLVSAFTIWEVAISQSLINNSEMWVEMNDEAIKSLDGLQKLFCQSTLQVPSTPSPSFSWETGLLELQFQVMKRKLNFMNSLKRLDEKSLARKILDEQQKNGWPGLAKECDKICDLINIPHISTNCVAKSEIDMAVREANKRKLIKEMQNYTKLKDSDTSCDFERKDYFKNKRIEEARTMFRINSGMFPCKMNMMSDTDYSKKLWFCDECESQIDSLSHIGIPNMYYRFCNEFFSFYA